MRGQPSIHIVTEFYPGFQEPEELVSLLPKADISIFTAFSVGT